MNKVVESNRIIYTPNEFAKNSLIYLQEIGSSKSMKEHKSSRNKLNSFLFMIVENGDGIFHYNGKDYHLKENDAVFVDCSQYYYHSSNNWKISWIHFYGNNSKNIYDKYIARDGKNVFKPKHLEEYKYLLNNIRDISSSTDYIKDISIHNQITSLLTTLMSETVYQTKENKSIYDIRDIKNYLDENFENNISLNNLSELFYINKYYLTRLFKETYATTINNYLNSKRITKAKQLLRFSDLDIDEIGKECGISDPNYFSRLFKKIEGITPKQYQKMWH